VKPVFDRRRATVWLAGWHEGNAIFRVTADGALAVAAVDYVVSLRLSGKDVLVDWAEGTFRLGPRRFAPFSVKTPRARLPRGQKGPIAKVLFAAYYQLYVFDAAIDPDELPELTADAVSKGYAATRRAVFLGTREHRNRHRVVFRRARSAPTVPRCDRALVLPLEVSSGRACVATLEDLPVAGVPLGGAPLVLAVPEGRYDLHVFAFEIAKRGERYELVLAPPRARRPRVLKGARRLIPTRSARRAPTRRRRSSAAG
jgi:hypothetical protein